jgi:hypothetical protein
VRFDPKAAFAAALIEYKEELIALPQAGAQTASNAELLGHILDEILVAALQQVAQQGDLPRPEPVISLLSVSIAGNRTGFYGDLLDLVSRPREEPFYTQYLGLYVKIIPDLVKLLGEHGTSVSSSPSREFFRYIVGMYLQEILGSKDGSPFLKFSMLTCGHDACSKVNDFLRSEERKTTIEILPEYNSEREATEHCIGGLKIAGRYSLLTCWTYYYRKPPRVELTKKDEAMAAQHWSVRLADAREFLKCIGTDKEISEIMGDRYSDVEKALEGPRAFVISGTQREEAEDTMVGIE